MLDSRAGLVLGGNTGPAIVPGKPDDSLLIQAIRYDDEDLQMPPRDHGGMLTTQQIADLTEWVRRGAPDPRVPAMTASGTTYGGVGKGPLGVPARGETRGAHRGGPLLGPVAGG